MTLSEFEVYRLASIARRKEEWHRSAFIAASVINCWRAKGQPAMTPEQLLGWPKPRTPPNMADYSDADSYYRAVAAYNRGE